MSVYDDAHGQLDLAIANEIIGGHLSNRCQVLAGRNGLGPGGSDGFGTRQLNVVFGEPGPLCNSAMHQPLGRGRAASRTSCMTTPLADHGGPVTDGLVRGRLLSTV